MLKIGLKPKDRFVNFIPELKVGSNKNYALHFLSDGVIKTKQSIDFCPIDIYNHYSLPQLSLFFLTITLISLIICETGNEIMVSPYLLSLSSSLLVYKARWKNYELAKDCAWTKLIGSKEL